MKKNNENIQKQILLEQVNQLYSNQVLPVGIALMNAIICVLILWPVISHKRLLIWIGVYVAITFWRWVLTFHYSKRPATAENADIYLKRFYAGVVCSASVWGIAAFTIFPEGDLARQAFLTFVVAGNCSGAVLSFSSSVLCHSTFVNVCLIPFIIRLFIAGTPMNLGMATMCLLYLGAVNIMGRKIYKNVLDVIVLSIKNLKQEEDIKKSNDRYGELIKNIPVGIYRCSIGQEDMFLMANSSLIHMFGYESFESFSKVSMNSLCVDKTEYDICHSALMSEGKMEAKALKMRKKDGSIIWGAITFRTITDEGGKPLFIDGVIQDVTTQKKAQEVLAKETQDLEVFRTLATGQTERMIELKKEVNELLKEKGLPPKYELTAGNDRGHRSF